jgi:hypothetical protein
MELDDMLQIMLKLVKDTKAKNPSKRAMINTLEMLGLAEYSKGCYLATPELIRLAYQSERFLSENCLALYLAGTTDKALDEDLTEDDLIFEDAPKRKRMIPSKKKATLKADASSSKKKAK